MAVGDSGEEQLSSLTFGSWPGAGGAVPETRETGFTCTPLPDLTPTELTLSAVSTLLLAPVVLLPAKSCLLPAVAASRVERTLLTGPTAAALADEAATLPPLRGLGGVRVPELSLLCLDLRAPSALT